MVEEAENSTDEELEKPEETAEELVEESEKNSGSCGKKTPRKKKQNSRKRWHTMDFTHY